jgi:hypothetical protein
MKIQTEEFFEILISRRLPGLKCGPPEVSNLTMIWQMLQVQAHINVTKMSR